jgi:hypothetical protein
VAQDKIESNADQRVEVDKDKPEWTIMIYLAGDNNLSSNSIAILQELENVTHDKDVRVVACFDSNTPLPKGARYVEINYGRYDTHKPPYPKMEWELHNDLVYPGHIVVSPDFCNKVPTSVTPIYEPTAKEGLTRFLNWATRKHLGKKNMLILFGHGTVVAGNTFLADNNPPSFLKLKDFGKLIKRFFPGDHKLDILACDNCVMNGLETAYEIRDHVNYILGSQGLMLTVGWPYRKVIEAIRRNKKLDPLTIAKGILKVCARNLLDFSLMDRSSEQSICDVTKLRQGNNIVDAVRDLGRVLQRGLEFKMVDGEMVLKYPLVCDAIRLARLEAQSYWDETFVDLYDFCELLIQKCNEILPQQFEMIGLFEIYLATQFKNSTTKEKDPKASGLPAEDLRRFLIATPVGQELLNIVEACRVILNQFKPRGKVNIVPAAYYVCPALQYSHGLSVYFPWTLPENPITFEPSKARAPQHPFEPREYKLLTAFDEYKKYDFARPRGANWASFLTAFFKATLRDVRRWDFKYDTEGTLKFYEQEAETEKWDAPSIDLQKSTSSTGDESEGSNIKNYPRRFYLSPNDCYRRMPVAGLNGKIPTAADRVAALPGQVSYLGWNIRGLVAEVIKLPTKAKSAKALRDEGGKTKSARPRR